ncbi:uncharacterized protein TRUGW13939_03361 [Talaromyces rugulosus]|uniref:FAD-binding PCMH-type domain-containing protein n=1 Tax=Talaromyces rugulosus TaxID=121627 RepID=A0A7H8QQM3_TALRU|nr:uncharacterized protein TRUGW13939_03361 [Talaromyces rugulosus]QKX56260.1 hypothetical protein TRUGW13939_03361 [Talaromyces rugulosus]
MLNYYISEDLSKWLSLTTFPCCRSRYLEILLNPDSSNFQEHLKRWTDINRQEPAAIILPSSEDECLKTVQWALKADIPFVTKSGGHSEWSTIDKNGVIIDLGRYSGVQVDVPNRKATLTGSVLSKDVAVALADVGLFTALGNGNTVGAIPYFLNGGASITTSITGFGADQILGARIITASGEIIEISQTQNPEILWAIRGAGQFFGLVTQLTIQAYPLSALGNDRGVIWAGTFVFPLDRASEVVSVMKDLTNNSEYATAGLLMVMAPPPTRQPSIVVAARYTGKPEDAVIAYQPLYNLNPIAAPGGEVPIQNASDARSAIGAKGDFKRFGVVGLHRFDPDAFLKTIDVWKDMVAQCPDAINMAFNFQWDTRPPRKSDLESAHSLQVIRYWQNNLIWHTDVKSRAIVDSFNDKCIAIMRGPNVAEYVDFANGTRDDPIERRFRGKEKLDKLRKLKEKWDKSGVFTRQFLDE